MTTTQSDLKSRGCGSRAQLLCTFNIPYSGLIYLLETDFLETCIFSAAEEQSVIWPRFVPCVWIYFKGHVPSSHTIFFKKMTQNVAFAPVNAESLQNTSSFS